MPEEVINGPRSLQKSDDSVDEGPLGEVSVASDDLEPFWPELEVSALLLLDDDPVGFLPARFATRYSQLKPLFSQRWHVGFLPVHFTLDVAQDSQLLRSRTPSGPV